MALFTKRDRIAIALISALILIGWGLRLAGTCPFDSGDMTITRIAAGEIPSPENADSLNVLLSDIYSPVNINTADSEKIQTLPMIGPAKAAAIIEYREKHGAFNDIEDIMNVNGIGPATFEKIRNNITVHSEN